VPSHEFGGEPGAARDRDLSDDPVGDED